MGTYSKSRWQGERKKGFDRNRVLPVADYYQPIDDLRFSIQEVGP
jgi:hypothetical protein